jgi:hypothetical protein
VQPSRVRLAYAYTVEVEPARKEGESHAPGPGLRLVVVVWPLGAGRPGGSAGLHRFRVLDREEWVHVGLQELLARWIGLDWKPSN